jgi:hypothetical protein
MPLGHGKQSKRVEGGHASGKSNLFPGVQRFGLKFHTEQREMSAYALTVAKGGPKLAVTADWPSSPAISSFAGWASSW